jgi:hypothetical protein
MSSLPQWGVTPKMCYLFICKIKYTDDTAVWREFNYPVQRKEEKMQHFYGKNDKKVRTLFIGFVGFATDLCKYSRLQTIWFSYFLDQSSQVNAILLNLFFSQLGDWKSSLFMNLLSCFFFGRSLSIFCLYQMRIGCNRSMPTVIIWSFTTSPTIVVCSAQAFDAIH